MQHPFVPDGQEREDSLEQTVVVPRQSRLLFKSPQNSITQDVLSGGEAETVANKRGKRSRSMEHNTASRTAVRAPKPTLVTAGSTIKQNARPQHHTATTEDETQDVPTPFDSMQEGDPAGAGAVDPMLSSMALGVHSPEPLVPRGSKRLSGNAAHQTVNHRQRVAGLTTKRGQTDTKTAIRAPYVPPAPHSNIVHSTVRGGHINETPVNVSTQLQFDEPVTATQGVPGEAMYPQPSPPPLFQLGGSNSRSPAGGSRSAAPDNAPLPTQHAKKVWEEQMNGFFDFIDRQPIHVVEEE